MKVTVENIKGLNKDLKVLIDKETMNSYMDEKYEEIKGTVNLKGFRPGKVPKEVLKRQFGKAVFGEVLDKVLKETSTKALEENKIKPAGQPKLDLKTYGEDKELENFPFIVDESSGALEEDVLNAKEMLLEHNFSPIFTQNEAKFSNEFNDNLHIHNLKIIKPQLFLSYSSFNQEKIIETKINSNLVEEIEQKDASNDLIF